MLIACLACGKLISDRAPARPFCGTKVAAPPVVAPLPERTAAPRPAEPVRRAVRRAQIQDARQKIQELKPA